MPNYLYGASVQGIQDFIFQTNKLKEIVGASQLVDNICTIEFKTFYSALKLPSGQKVGELNPKDIIMSAAGNIKCLLEEEVCRALVRTFPKYISNLAPGITISQAVVKCSDNLKTDIDLLEQRLKTQRNKPDMPIDIGFMGLERARRTGGVAYERNGELLDRATCLKTDNRTKDSLQLFAKFSGTVKVKAEEVPFDMSDITKQKDNGWLAVVHADGNGLGVLLQNLANKLDTNEKVKVAFATFSAKLEQATQEAAQAAFKAVIPEKTGKNRYPIRPVVLGGDDLTVIIRADLAFDFTKTFLKAFEEKTKTHFAFMKTTYGVTGFEKGLTACAGIAYIKEAYPFHYGVDLAENLTSATKKLLKERYNGKAPSALNFYKVQASFIDDLKSMKARTHFAKAANVSFDYGPYLTGVATQTTAHVAELKEPLEFLKEEISKGKSGVSKLRQWAAELHKDKSKAVFMLDRIIQVNEELEKNFDLKDFRTQLAGEEQATTNINDLIVLSSF